MIGLSKEKEEERISGLGFRWRCACSVSQRRLSTPHVCSARAMASTCGRGHGRVSRPGRSGKMCVRFVRRGGKICVRFVRVQRDGRSSFTMRLSFTRSSGSNPSRRSRAFPGPRRLFITWPPARPVRSILLGSDGQSPRGRTPQTGCPLIRLRSVPAFSSSSYPLIFLSAIRVVRSGHPGPARGSRSTSNLQHRDDLAIRAADRQRGDLRRDVVGR